MRAPGRECVSADLEIELYRQGDEYRVGLSLEIQAQEVPQALTGAPPVLEIDTEHLTSLDSGEDYGRALATAFFSQSVREFFQQALAQSVQAGGPLRVRLSLRPDAADLHDLRWETLQDPEGKTSLFLGDNVLFSRYVPSGDQRPVVLTSRSQLNAAIAVSMPKDISNFGFADVDVAAEINLAQKCLDGIPAATVRSPGVTLDRIASALREGVDILYLVCHGSFSRKKKEPCLYLENDVGNTQPVYADDLVRRFGELGRLPRLVILAACQSAGEGGPPGKEKEEAQALAAVGPRLAQAGVPAVIAMQGKISIATLHRFMPAFFSELSRDGQIDRAMAVARGAIRNEPDWWMPVLFLRLKSGRMWYPAGFGSRQRLEKWPAVISNIEKGRFTPILGPGLTETVIGSLRDLARSWASRYGFPMAPEDRDDLPHVAQYLAVNQQPMFPKDELVDHIKEDLLKRHAGLLAGSEGQSLEQILSRVGTTMRAGRPADPYRVLAGLPCPMYITTDPSSLLEDALRETPAHGTPGALKQPRVEMCPWNDSIGAGSRPSGDEKPDPDHPLVYHLYGVLSDPGSMVLTEDDYFDYIIGASRNRDLIPGMVRSALVNSALLFLGFRLDDWSFRVLFRNIMSLEGSTLRRKYAHIAVQVDPEGGAILEPERARRYLEKYFDPQSINIYWGGVEDFASEMDSQWRAR